MLNIIKNQLPSFDSLFLNDEGSNDNIECQAGPHARDIAAQVKRITYKGILTIVLKSSINTPSK